MYRRSSTSIFMPLLAQQRLRLLSSAPLRCSNTLRTSTSTNPLARQQRRTGQTSVLTTCTDQSTRSLPLLLSPHQWSHIVHRIRKPTASGVSSIMAKKGQSRTHTGHSHSHGHQHDNTYLTSKNKGDPGVRITRIGLYVNLGMAIVKGAGGYIFHSQAYVSHVSPFARERITDFRNS